MESASILITLAITILVISFLARPLQDTGANVAAVASQELSELKAQRDGILDSIADLDLSFQMGKVDEADYRPSRRQLAEQGAAVLRAIDETQTVDTGGTAPEPAEAQMLADRSFGDAILEAEIQAVKERLSDGDLPQSGFCTQCGGSVAKGDRFCTACGAEVVD